MHRTIRLNAIETNGNAIEEMNTRLEDSNRQTGGKVNLFICTRKHQHREPSQRQQHSTSPPCRANLTRSLTFQRPIQPTQAFRCQGQL